MFGGPVGQKLPQPKLFRPDQMAEAVAEAVERAAPSGRRKYVEKRFKMSPDDARRVVEGRASKAHLDKMFREGGWAFVLEVFALFFDRRIDQHLAEEAHKHARDAERLRALASHSRPRADLGGDGPDGVAVSRHGGNPTSDRRVGQGSSGRSD